ncbi:hypothetical protein CANINC_001211 [Pichia inconspicua]|uniref:SMP-30/Gluconolactonase/LRE-like region domain-containing protein n=1 Tax=Pichia inconspicua TaxID=52247 RepID=A0A4T0X5V8_9ASCO|nr:hypothetical protein CANINC_001211 [[Candida] inconspicua]
MTLQTTITTPFITPHGNLLEGVTYDGRTDTLYYINIHTGEVFLIPSVSTHDSTTSLPPPSTSFKVSDTIGVIGLTTATDTLICGVERGIVLLNVVTGTITPLVMYPDNNVVDNRQLRSNDGSVAPDGAFWVGTMVKNGEIEPLGSMYRLQNSKSSLEQLWSQCMIPNGINWDTTRNILYWTESKEHSVYAFDVQGESYKPDFTTKRILLHHEGEPDGSCLDSKGNLYVAVWGTGKVVRVSPNDKSIDMEWHFPCKNVSCVTFGGPLLDQMYVTTATNVDSTDETELPAAVFKVDLSQQGVKGLPKNLFTL